DDKSQKRGNWEPWEDELILELLSRGMPWSYIASRLPGRSPIACRRHYDQNLTKEAREFDRPRVQKRNRASLKY
ncbi:hypothetical protein EDB80DRAFT_518574, partial [Ilyonectria destructans]